MTKIRSKNQAKRKQILVAATQLFTQQGYASTSMLHIAQQADVSKQTVYSHFGSKEELFSAAIAQKCDSSILLEFDQLDLTKPRATLIHIARHFFDMITSKEALAVHKICAFESKTYPQLSELFYQAGPERLTAEMAKLLAEFDAQGVLSIDNVHYAATQFLHLMKGEAWLRIEFNTKRQLSAEEIDDYIESSVDLFMRGYSATNN